MTVALTIIAWVICAGIMCGVMMHVYPDEWGDDPVFCMGMCLMTWPIFALMGIGLVVIKQLSKVGMFFAGLFDKAFEREEEKDE